MEGQFKKRTYFYLVSSNMNVIDLFVFKYDLDRGITHPKFDPTGVQIKC